mgnify:FL=1
MDEEEVQRRRREQDEKATRQRATILGLPYVDMRNLEATLPLVPGMIPIEKMHQYRIVPLAKGGNEVMYQIGVTSQTPQSILQKIKREYQDRGDKLQFLLISASGR